MSQLKASRVACCAVTDDLETLIAGLAKLSLEELRTEWLRRQRRAPPRCRSPQVLRGLLAWAIQASACGGLSADTRRELRKRGEGAREGSCASRREVSRLMPGTVLTRQWRGAVHKVLVLEEGFAYEGKIFDDLSSIAREITGTRWSGPRFFGLRPAHAHPEGTRDQ